MTENKQIKIGVHEYKPLVYKEKGDWTGLEVELWKKIAKQLDMDYEFVEEKHFASLLDRASSGDFDLAMAGITRTTNRAEKLNMSYFTLDTGLGIAVMPSHDFSLRDLLKGLFSKQTMLLLSLLVLFAVITAHFYWLIEGGHSVSATYMAGVFEAFWWGIVTFSTVGYGDISPVTTLGKLFGVASILSGLALFGLYIGQLSASLTLTKMKSKIVSAEDLANKKVGVKANTTAKDIVSEKRAKVVEYEELQSAYSALREHQVDAVVADLPVLQAQKKKDDFILTGGVFSRQAYAYVLPKNDTSDALLQQINQSIIQLRESGEYDSVYEKYLSE